MVALLITVLVVAVVVYVLFWLVDQIGLPGPVPMVVKAIVAILALVFILQRGGLLGAL